MLITETKLIVRYAETDRMGIVHHSNYPIWFEAGRTDFIRKVGLPYSQIEDRGIMLPLLELKCNFKSPANYEDEIIVKTSIKEMTYTRIVFYYEVYKDKQESVLSTGETMHVWTDKNLKPVNLKKFAPEIYKLLCSVT
ncbi:MAG: thioesterase family protein [Bacillota bacterium]|nr:thioesterase family protein [Bacillota bacterium]